MQVVAFTAEIKGNAGMCIQPDIVTMTLNSKGNQEIDKEWKIGMEDEGNSTIRINFSWQHGYNENLQYNFNILNKVLSKIMVITTRKAKIMIMLNKQKIEVLYTFWFNKID